MEVALRGRNMLRDEGEGCDGLGQDVCTIRLEEDRIYPVPARGTFRQIMSTVLKVAGNAGDVSDYRLFFSCAPTTSHQRVDLEAFLDLRFSNACLKSIRDTLPSDMSGNGLILDMIQERPRGVGRPDRQLVQPPIDPTDDESPLQTSRSSSPTPLGRRQRKRSRPSPRKERSPSPVRLSPPLTPRARSITPPLHSARPSSPSPSPSPTPVGRRRQKRPRVSPEEEGSPSPDHPSQKPRDHPKTPPRIILSARNSKSRPSPFGNQQLHTPPNSHEKQINVVHVVDAEPAACTSEPNSQGEATNPIVLKDDDEVPPDDDDVLFVRSSCTPSPPSSPNDALSRPNRKSEHSGAGTNRSFESTPYRKARTAPNPQGKGLPVNVDQQTPTRKDVEIRSSCTPSPPPTPRLSTSSLPSSNFPLASLDLGLPTPESSQSSTAELPLLSTLRMTVQQQQQHKKFGLPTPQNSQRNEEDFELQPWHFQMPGDMPFKTSASPSSSVDEDHFVEDSLLRRQGPGGVGIPAVLPDYLIRDISPLRESTEEQAETYDPLDLLSADQQGQGGGLGRIPNVAAAKDNDERRQSAKRESPQMTKEKRDRQWMERFKSMNELRRQNPNWRPEPRQCPPDCCTKRRARNRCVGPKPVAGGKKRKGKAARGMNDSRQRVMPKMDIMSRLRAQPYLVQSYPYRNLLNPAKNLGSSSLNTLGDFMDAVRKHDGFRFKIMDAEGKGKRWHLRFGYRYRSTSKDFGRETTLGECGITMGQIIRFSYEGQEDRDTEVLNEKKRVVRPGRKKAKVGPGSSMEKQRFIAREEIVV